MVAPQAGLHNPNGHSDADVVAAVRGDSGTRTFTFRYELRDFQGTVKGAYLDNVISCSINFDSTADVQRTATFTVRDTGVIDYGRDRITPWIRLWLPPFGPNDFVEYPHGEFLLSTPKRQLENGAVTRSVEAYDQNQVLLETKAMSRPAISPAWAPNNYSTTIDNILSQFPLPRRRVVWSPITVPAERSWDVGIPWLTVLTDLGNAINYRPLYFDGDGWAIAEPHHTAAENPSTWTFADNEHGVTLPKMEHELDLFAVPNQWTLYVSESDRPTMQATYTNNDPSSPTSVPARGRVISSVEQYNAAATQAVLNAKVQKAAFDQSQIYEAITFETAMFPMWEPFDVYTIQNAPLTINHKYQELSVSYDLQAGATMQRVARRIVTV